MTGKLSGVDFFSIRELYQNFVIDCRVNKAGGDKGEPYCFKIMWDIYAGKTVLDVRHDGNAELCYQWFLEAANGNIEDTALSDYLDHSYEMLGGDVTTWGERKFPISLFPGKFVTTVIDIWITKIKQFFHEIRGARLTGIPINQIKQTENLSTPSISDLVLFHLFLSNCVQDSHDIMKRAMTGTKKEDLEYCFSGSKNPKQTISQYTPYLSPISTMAEKEINKPSKAATINRLFNRIFSKK